MSVSRIEFEFEFGNTGFGGERTQEYPEKTSLSREENSNKTQPTYDAVFGKSNQVREDMGGEHIPASQVDTCLYNECWFTFLR